MSADCTSTRAWLSAYRDGEALPDTSAATHLEGCHSCRTWESSLDHVTRRMAVREAGGPDLTGPAMQAWARGGAQPARIQLRVARIILGIAGCAGLVLAAATAAGNIGPAGGH